MRQVKKISMAVEKSAGAVIFFEKEKKREYLLLHYPGSTKKTGGYWDFPKGHIEKGEKEIDAMRREIKEETSLENIKVIDGFRIFIKYFFRKENKNVFKTVTYYLVQSFLGEIKISSEHIGFLWLPYEKAIEKATFDNTKEALFKADNFLRKQKPPLFL